ncbi:MAG: hypothetical protein WA908_08890 [Pontixanthobacter sp.]
MRNTPEFNDPRILTFGAIALGIFGLAGGVYYAIRRRNLMGSDAGKHRDLKKISGIGSQLETLLKREGVGSIEQIAGWDPTDIDRMNSKLNFHGRIERDDWVGQAKRLTQQ